MGCGASTPKGENNEKSGLPGPLVFTPGQRILIDCKWQEALNGRVSPEMTRRLADARFRLAGATGAVGFSQHKDAGNKKKAAARKAKDPASIVKYVEEYLPLLLGLTKEGGSLSDAVEFGWTNEEDSEGSTSLKSAHYELVSALHVMAVATLESANVGLTPKPAYEGAPVKVTKDARTSAVDMLLRAAGMIDAALTALAAAPDIKSKAPADIKEGTLKALKYQALAQAAELKVEISEDEVRTPLESKMRLSVKARQLWRQAVDSMAGVDITPLVGKETPGWGEKHKAFLQWKFADASAVAYYYFGLVLDEGKEKNTHANAVACFKKADAGLKQGAVACKDFGMTKPLTRTPPPVGPLSYLTEKIPRDAMSKARINKDVYYMEKEPETAPALPNVDVAIDPTPYSLPDIDDGWLFDRPGPKPPSGGGKVQEPSPQPDSKLSEDTEPQASSGETSVKPEGETAPAEREKVAVPVSA